MKIPKKITTWTRCRCFLCKVDMPKGVEAIWDLGKGIRHIRCKVVRA